MSAVIEEPTKQQNSLIPRAQADQIIEIDRTSQAFQRAIIEADDQGNHTSKALLIARAIRTLQKLFTDDLMEDIMALQGTPLGFRTDRDRPKQGMSPGYEVKVVRDVVIQAVLRGFQVTGNQINIIAGNLYVTKEGFENRLQNFEGLTDFEVDFEVPDILTRQGTALVGCVARWRFNGKLGELACTKTTKGDYRIPIRINDGQTDDALLGKAKSKLFRKVFERLSGMATDGIDDRGIVDADDVVQPKITDEPQASSTPSPELLDATVDQELSAALLAVRNRNQFEACKEYWRNKARNRELSQGQMATIGERFAMRESQGFA